MLCVYIFKYKGIIERGCVLVRRKSLLSFNYTNIKVKYLGPTGFYVCNIFYFYWFLQMCKNVN